MELWEVAASLGMNRPVIETPADRIASIDPIAERVKQARADGRLPPRPSQASA